MSRAVRRTMKNVDVGSDTFDFSPGPHIAGGALEWDVGTAGSATMLALGVLPVACLADAPVCARITGGLFQDFEPSSASGCEGARQCAWRIA